jgi:hypothetical protein
VCTPFESRRYVCGKVKGVFVRGVEVVSSMPPSGPMRRRGEGVGLVNRDAIEMSVGYRISMFVASDSTYVLEGAPALPILWNEYRA